MNIYLLIVDSKYTGSTVCINIHVHVFYSFLIARE